MSRVRRIRKHYEERGAPDRETFGMALSLSSLAPTKSAAHATAGMPDAFTANSMYRGSGVGVAIVDSGVGNHMDLLDGKYQRIGGIPVCADRGTQLCTWQQ